MSLKVQISDRTSDRKSIYFQYLSNFVVLSSCNNSSHNLSIISLCYLLWLFSLYISPSVFLISDSSHDIHKSSFSHYSEEALGCDNIVLGKAVM